MFVVTKLAKNVTQFIFVLNQFTVMLYIMLYKHYVIQIYSVVRNFAVSWEMVTPKTDV